jgi:plasmid stabilization system protein ParE
MRLAFTPEFRSRLDGLFEYIRDQSGSTTVARRTVTGILSRVSILRSYPDAGMRLCRDDDTDTGVMILILGRYIVTYVRTKDTILVTSLLDSRTEEFSELRNKKQ